MRGTRVARPAARLERLVHPRRDMRVAFATLDGVRVNAELRTAPRLDVYDLEPHAIRLQRSFTFEDVANGHGARIRALAGVSIVYVSASGPSAAARLASHGIQVATSRTRERIDLLLSDLRRLAASSPGAVAQPEGEEPAA